LVRACHTRLRPTPSMAHGLAVRRGRVLRTDRCREERRTRGGTCGTMTCSSGSLTTPALHRQPKLPEPGAQSCRITNLPSHRPPPLPHIHTHVHTCTHANTHTHMYIRTHTHTHTHMRTCIISLPPSPATILTPKDARLPAASPPGSEGSASHWGANRSADPAFQGRACMIIRCMIITVHMLLS